LAEIINNGSIGLPQAAWNARMSQSDAAARLVTMAERGMPLRLVVEGDQQLLWRIAQAQSQPQSDPTRRTLVSGAWMQQITGPGGEQLDVTLQQIIDPADVILTSAGHQLDPGQRALLVQITVGNRGPVDFNGVPDRYLVIQDSTGAMLSKDNTPVEGYPANYTGVPAATLVAGWTLFLVPAATEVAQVHWSLDPSDPERTLSWTFGPA
jgi:hypothetical protein